MTYKVLVDLGINDILAESYAQTQTGQEILTKYQSILMTNAESCGLVNQLIREASQCRYDKGINEMFEKLADYIQSNKTSWALASACEGINNRNSRYDMFNKNAVKLVEKLLEQDEENIVKNIRAGILKPVMFCESFRSIAKQVYADRPIVEHKAEYTKVTPVSMIQEVPDGYYFVVENMLYKLDGNKCLVDQPNVNETSQDFRIVSNLLASEISSIDENKITVKFNNKEYVVEEEDVIKFADKEMTCEQFRDYSRMVISTWNPFSRNNAAQILESIAILAENFDRIGKLSNVAVYTTKNDKFIVIESGDKLYASLLKSNRHPQWTINENAIDAISFIKTKTNTEISDEYTNAIQEAVNNIDEEKKAEIQESIRESKEQALRERVSLLQEKHKDNPLMLALISKVTEDFND